VTATGKPALNVPGRVPSLPNDRGLRFHSDQPPVLQYEVAFKPHERLAGARLAANFVMNFEKGSEPSFSDGDGFTEAALPSLNGHLEEFRSIRGAIYVLPE